MQRRAVVPMSAGIISLSDKTLSSINFCFKANLQDALSYAVELVSIMSCMKNKHFRSKNEIIQMGHMLIRRFKTFPD